MADYVFRTQTEFGDGTVEEPVNHEYPVGELISSFLTPPHLSYHRNHGPIPHPPSAQSHTLTITFSLHGLSPTNYPLTLTPDQLATSYPQHSVTCALQCAGNRRHTMRTRLKEVQGIDWFDGAVMNCKWEGPRVRDVLLRAGLEQAVAKWTALKKQKEEESGEQTAGGEKEGEEENKYKGLHLQFACHLVPTQEDSYYGGSIPLSRAMDEDMDVILALKMNSSPLPHSHGAPIRALIPGYLGARSVKWLTHITLSESESPNHYQRRDYKVLPPEAVDAEAAEGFWESTEAMGEMGVNSGVGVPTENGVLKRREDGYVEVKGWAVPGGSGKGGAIVRVECSSDEGESWREGEILEPQSNKLEGGIKEGGRKQGKWGWALWRCWLPMEKGEGKRIFCRAFDEKGNGQPRFSQWNLRGVGYNGWGEVGRVRVE